jgi:hypothetical protein
MAQPSMIEHADAVWDLLKWVLGGIVGLSITVMGCIIKRIDEKLDDKVGAKECAICQDRFNDTERLKKEWRDSHDKQVIALREDIGNIKDLIISHFNGKRQ